MLSRGNILVVDDEVNLCRILDAKLYRSGYKVMTVHDGLQAVEKVRERRFDVVLLDLILPKLGGLEALERIRKIDAELPVIVMTACENSDALMRARDQGVAAFVSKPFDLDRLVHLVQSTSTGGRTAAGESEVPEPSGIFQPGQKAEVEPEAGGPRLRAAVLARSSDILHLAFDGDAPPLTPGTRVRVSVGAPGALYRFSGELVREGGNGRASVTIPPVIHRVQRRRSPRLDIRAPAVVNAGGRCLRGETRNIGAGGICITAAEPLEAGTEATISVAKLPSLEQFRQEGQVVRCGPLHEEEPRDRFEVAICFPRPDPGVHRMVLQQMSGEGRLSS